MGGIYRGDLLVLQVGEARRTQFPEIIGGPAGICEEVGATHEAQASIGNTTSGNFALPI